MAGCGHTANDEAGRRCGAGDVDLRSSTGSLCAQCASGGLTLEVAIRTEMTTGVEAPANTSEISNIEDMPIRVSVTDHLSTTVPNA